MKEEKIALVIADIYLLLSGQKNYFFNQKIYYINEIERLTQMYQRQHARKREYKKLLTSIKETRDRTEKMLNDEIRYLRDKITVGKEHIDCQTDIDYYQMNNIIRSSSSTNYYKGLFTNKLSDYVERIQFNCSQVKPLSYKSLLNLIPEIYNEKILSDNKQESEGNNKLQFDLFFYEFMQNKFKLRKLIDNNCESTIMAIIKYAGKFNI